MISNKFESTHRPPPATTEYIPGITRQKGGKTDKISPEARVLPFIIHLPSLLSISLNGYRLKREKTSLFRSLELIPQLLFFEKRSIISKGNSGNGRGEEGSVAENEREG